MEENNFLQKNFYIICGDRHWKYHSIHPGGFEEFSAGSLIDQNARLGVLPGDKNSTDPEGTIVQPYTDAEPAGGFLKVNVMPASETQDKPSIVFILYGEDGEERYKEVKPCKDC